MNPEKSIDILFVILDVELMIENSSVFQAQVVDQAAALRRMGYTVAILCAFRNEDQFNMVAGNKLESIGVRTILVRDRGLWKNIFVFTYEIGKLKANYYVRNGYVRSFWAAFPIILSNPARILPYTYDVRGDIIDESIQRGSNKHRFFVIQLLERLSLRRARYVSCVTNRLANIITQRARLDVNPIVIPSCIDLNSFLFDESRRIRRRVELGYSADDIVIVYSGGLSNYQMIPEMLALWRRLAATNFALRFLMLINSDPRSLARSSGDLEALGDRLQIMKLQRTEVFETLNSADIGFLLRETRELNATASPVKFAEYLAAGLSVVSSPGVGDLSNLIIDQHLGILISPMSAETAVDKVSDFLNRYREDRLIYQKRSLQLARQHYNWEAHNNSFFQLYGKPGDTFVPPTVG
jgi:glycosyltransferase involved in cell wall biosynthesis